MFWWLGVAMIIDGLDGPMARRFDVARVQPNWSGDVLDLVVDFTTYVFVPPMPLRRAACCRRYCVSARICDRGDGRALLRGSPMKSADNHFRGFPGLWNFAAFYLFLLQPPPLLGGLALSLLVVPTFVPFHVIHPVRVSGSDG